MRNKLHFGISYTIGQIARNPYFLIATFKKGFVLIKYFFDSNLVLLAAPSAKSYPEP